MKFRKRFRKRSVTDLKVKTFKDRKLTSDLSSRSKLRTKLAKPFRGSVKNKDVSSTQVIDPRIKTVGTSTPQVKAKGLSTGLVSTIGGSSLVYLIGGIALYIILPL